MSSDQKLGTLRLRHEITNEIIIIPTPSNDPSDPLNWPISYKYFVAGLSSWAIFLATFCAAGPAVVLPQMATSFFGPPGPHFSEAIAKSAYFVTVCALMMGVSNLIWVPLMIKYGRRPVYIGAYVLYAACAAWCASAKSYGSMLAARAILGCAAGAAEVLGPLTIADIFFVHERGKMMVIYTCTLSAGTSIGATVSGLITMHHSWRVIFWLACGLSGASAIVMFLTLPETLYQRNIPETNLSEESDDLQDCELEKQASAQCIEGDNKNNAVPPIQLNVGERPSFTKIITTFPTKTYTREPLWKLALRPIILIVLPSALWASLVMAVSIGFLVAMSSNISTAFSTTYGFPTWKIGVVMLSGVVGSCIAVWFGGPFSDIVADRLTRNNDGVREPEMRLPAMMISLVTGPLALILYGVGIGNHLHWICPAIGLALINFTIVQAANVSVVYMIDCYRPIAGEVTMTQYLFKSLFGFLLSFYTNVWISESGYIRAFGEMACISGVVFLGSIVFYLWGKPLRQKSWRWSVMKTFVYWKGDRDVGE